MRKLELPEALADKFGGHYGETQVPPSFWMLFAIAGFALTCMGAAAFTVMRDLAEMGGAFDKLLLFSIFLAVPFYLIVGFKLLLVRKRIDFKGEVLRVAFVARGWTIWSRTWYRKDIRDFKMENHVPTQNLAPRQHRDSQYYIRGHWRLVAETHQGKKYTLDKNTDAEALEPLLNDLKSWLSGLVTAG
jgi:hypothetical protein